MIMRIARIDRPSGYSGITVAGRTVREADKIVAENAFPP
jgi:hypothetical protein